MLGNCIVFAQKFHTNLQSTFAEAVQSVWFIQCILQIESNGHSLIIWPF
ncbi:MAG: pyruvate formate lyase family protein [Streptococcus parasanguinis]